MEMIGRCGKTTDADMAVYVKEENQAQLNEQAEQEWEDGDFNDTEAQIGQDEANEELKGELKREKAKLVAEAGACMKEKVAGLNSKFAREELEDHPPFCDKPPYSGDVFWACHKAEMAGLIIAPVGTIPEDILKLNPPKRLFISATGQLGINRHLGACNFTRRV